MSIAWDSLSVREKARILDYVDEPNAVRAIVLVEEWTTSFGDREMDEAEAVCHEAQARYLRAMHGGAPAEQHAALEAVTAAAEAFARAVVVRFVRRELDAGRSQKRPCRRFNS